MKTMCIQDRLKIVLNDLFDNNLNSFSDVTGIPKRLLESYLRGGKEWPMDRLLQLSRSGISLDWLLTGRGTMNLQSDEADTALEPALEAVGNFSSKSKDRDAVSIPVFCSSQNDNGKGYVNISTPFNGIAVAGVPDSNMFYPLLDALIQSESDNSWSMYVCANELRTLGPRLYAQFQRQRSLELIPGDATFMTIDFSDLSVTNRFNPLRGYESITQFEADKLARMLMFSIIQVHNRTLKEMLNSLGFFRRLCECLLAAAIYIFVNRFPVPFDANDEPLTVRDGAMKVFVNAKGNESIPHYWRGRYATLAHVLAFLTLDTATLLAVIECDTEAKKFLPRYASVSGSDRDKFIEEFDGITRNFRNYISQLLTPEVCWVLSGHDIRSMNNDCYVPFYAYLSSDQNQDASSQVFTGFIMNFLLDSAGQQELGETRISSNKANGWGVLIENAVTTPVFNIGTLLGTGRERKIALSLGIPSLREFDRVYDPIKSEEFIPIFDNIFCTSLVDSSFSAWLTRNCIGKIPANKPASSAIADTEVTPECSGEPSRDAQQKQKGKKNGYVAPAEVVQTLGNEWVAGIVSVHSKKENTFLVQIDTRSKRWKLLEEPLPVVHPFAKEPKKRQARINSVLRSVRSDVDSFCRSILSSRKTSE